jgi:hypothetical protein
MFGNRTICGIGAAIPRCATNGKPTSLTQPCAARSR